MSVKAKFAWFDGDNVRPYVYVRPENNISLPGTHFSMDWFPGTPVFKNPLRMAEVDFANQILRLEGHVFASSQMAMPRWVFFDCAIIPGFVAGFAIKTRLLPKALRDLMQPDPASEWSPLSLFIMIPSMCAQEWVAHNLSSANAALPESERYYGLGFLSKAFGLWYANVEVCCGVTQWQGPALRLHSHYGALEILTAYTPVHSIAETLAYRLRTDPSYWPHFFDGQPVSGFKQKFQPTGLTVETAQKHSLIALQEKIEAGQGPFYLDGNEIRRSSNGALTVYTPK